MSWDETQIALRNSIDKRTRITFSDGEILVVIVQTVDVEGFLFDVEGGETGYWTPFEEVASIEPAGLA